MGGSLADLATRRGGWSPTHHPDDEIEVGELCIQVAAHEVTKAGVPVTLTAREFDLLVFLAARPRRAFRREELLERVWGYTYGDTAGARFTLRLPRERVE